MASPIPRIDRDVLTVANLIRTSRAGTRQELAQSTGMGRNTVSTLIQAAIEARLLVPDGSAPSTGGRAPATWRFRHESGLILVIGVHSTTLRLAVTDLAGTPLAQDLIDWPITRGPEDTLAEASRRLTGLARQATEQHGEDLEVWGAGVSLPGPINQVTGRPTAPPIMPGWDGYDVVGSLEATLGVPVVVDNDVNTMLLGYAATLPDQHHRRPGDMLYVQIGTGIGAGLMSTGHVHRGADGAAGDIGHVRVVDADNVVCRCGRTGCLEAVAGGWALLRDARRAAAEGLSPHLRACLEETGTLTIEDIVSGVSAGDTECVTLMVRSATAVGDALAMLVSFFNPGRVVLAGPMPQGCPLFLSVARRLVSERALALATSGLEVVAAESGFEDEKRGAALLAVNALFEAVTES
ncbi:ROK family protein [Actinomyces howellii]|uniref:Glucokinase n=1 Tax=Actinomyces howellii TaxID=52771 RepID=A0A3S4SNU5_9ACTO|nr:ROK family protein [Actinomyces howellii]VEG29261.1 Glucokinase [Actinomyces howellii]